MTFAGAEGWLPGAIVIVVEQRFFAFVSPCHASPHHQRIECSARQLTVYVYRYVVSEFRLRSTEF